MKIKKILLSIMAMAVATSFAACTPTATGDVGSQSITVISREDGSGTRGAFIEITGIEEKDADGNKTDKTTKEAIIADKTDVMLSQVAGNESAIGYVSVSSLNENIKAVKVDGAEPTTENIKSGVYSVSRPFYIATSSEQSDVTKDFISFILSKEGQEIVGKSCISVDDSAAEFAGSKPSGKVVIAGSSSVTPVMEKLVEEYKTFNPNATLEVQQGDSTSGMQAAVDGVCDIGMASRELKDSEKEKLQATQIAIDGIAVVVNKANTIEDISKDNIKNIFTGAVTAWADVK